MNVHNLIILDESGSMSRIANEAISGVNETIQTIRAAEAAHEDQEHFVSLVSFNSAEISTVYNKVPADEVKELTSREYRPRCCTPLYDAIGSAINELRDGLTEEDAVLVTIITDGIENDSREFRQSDIRSLVDSLKEKGWLFTFIGAQDVESAAHSLSIKNTLVFETSIEGTNLMFKKENACRGRLFDLLHSEGKKCFSHLDERYFEDLLDQLYSQD